MSFRTRSFLWITFSYLLCCGAALAWLLLAPGDILLNSFIADVIATLVIFGFSRVFRNSSFYDAYWSVIPPLFLLYWWFTREHETTEARAWLVGIVVWYWGARLTGNWAHHWEGLNQEDWRYPIIKQKYPKFEFFSDFFGLHFFPTVQVFLGMLPMYYAIALSDVPLNWLDGVAFFVGMSAVTIQLVADIQLHRFIANRKPGQIIDSGLWSWSRHPNYFGELSFWFSNALFGLAAWQSGSTWQPWVFFLGFVAMLAMFLGASIPLMEKRSLERRPQYQDIINRISMLVPLPPRKP